MKTLDGITDERRAEAARRTNPDKWASGRGLISNITSIYSVSACPDGRFVLLALIGEGGGSGTNIWRANADGTNLKQLSNGQNDTGPECSPDSQWAYFIDQNANRVERVPVDGGTPETLPGTPVPHAFVTESRLSYPDLGQMIASVPLDAGPQPHVRLFDPNPAIADSPRFTSDGKALVYSINQNSVGTCDSSHLTVPPGARSRISRPTGFGRFGGPRTAKALAFFVSVLKVMLSCCASRQRHSDAPGLPILLAVSSGVRGRSS